MSSPSSNRAASYPDWLPMPACTVHAVCGPPGPGLRRHVAAHAQPGARIIDIAEIIDRLSAGAAGNWAPLALEERNRELAALEKAQPDEEVWLISPSPRQWQRDWWATHLNARVWLIDPGKETAMAEAAKNGVNVRWVHVWYDEYADPNGQTTPPARSTRERHLAGAPAGRKPVNSAAKYGTKQGQMRTAQLKRQKWCERCEAEGRGRVVATDLNHRVPFMRPDKTPDYKLFGDPKNHESLCRTCHNAHGARTDRDASPLGSGSDGRPLDPNHPWNRK